MLRLYFQCLGISRADPQLEPAECHVQVNRVEIVHVESLDEHHHVSWHSVAQIGLRREIFG